MKARPRLLFVYNADSGLFNALGDIGHKLFSPETYPCQLCALTHGLLRERQDWRGFIGTLEADCEFLHRDQFHKRFLGLVQPLPAVFRLVDGSPRACLDPGALAAAAGIDDLKQLILTRCLECAD